MDVKRARVCLLTVHEGRVETESYCVLGEEKLIKLMLHFLIQFISIKIIVKMSSV